jgi:Lrp/AsnC family transcriptional regulator, leucine-responsive regulatory protein
VNPAKLGLGLTVIIRFQSTRTSPPDHILALVAACPEVVECHRVTGDDCMTLTAVVASVEHLDALITRLTPYGASYTSIVLSSPLRHRAIGPTALLRGEESA